MTDPSAPAALPAPEVAPPPAASLPCCTCKSFCEVPRCECIAQCHVCDGCAPGKVAKCANYDASVYLDSRAKRVSRTL
jgi:hypothetical protein